MRTTELTDYAHHLLEPPFPGEGYEACFLKGYYIGVLAKFVEFEKMGEAYSFLFKQKKILPGEIFATLLFEAGTLTGKCFVCPEKNVRC